MSEDREKEEKGFVFKDRRKAFAEDREEKSESRGGSEAAREGESKGAEAGKESFAAGTGPEAQEQASRVPLPEVDFSTFVFSLSSSALLHLGEVPDPSTRQVREDLDIAKHVIDTLGMLEEKTRGNLDKDEEQLIKSVLYDLRMRYVKKRGK